MASEHSLGGTANLTRHRERRLRDLAVGRGRPVRAHHLAAAALMVLLVACTSGAGAPPPEGPGRSLPVVPEGPAEVVFTGHIVTMDHPARVEAMAIAKGRVLALGDLDEVMAHAGNSTQVIDLGSNVAYPGFVDAHSHWIGDRDQMGLDAPQAMDSALAHGWTSVAELWVDRERMAELRDLDATGQLRLRVDGYLAMNLPAPSGEHLGDWYREFEAGFAPSDRLRFPGVKFTLDNGWGSLFWWEPEELADTIARAHDSGWQVASHTVSTEAHQMLLAALEAALNGRPNLLRHRIEHAVQVTDEQLGRIAELDLVAVVQLGGSSSDWILEQDYLGNLGEDTAWLARWRDLVEAGIHVAGAPDAPWTFPGLVPSGDVGTPMAQIAGAMDGIGPTNPHPPDWVLAQTLTAEQGLELVTTGGAYALRDEMLRGRLAPGTFADITILTGDVAAGTPSEIRQMSVVATIVGGVAEFCADRAMCPTSS
jgi:predicted amidohydrolase YtcJ